MEKRKFPGKTTSSSFGALRISAIYLLLGILWILFSDVAAARIAPNSEALKTISIYKGWGFIVVTALLLYWLIHQHATVLQESEKKLRLVIDSVPALISYVGADRRYQFTNQAYKEWFGCSVDGITVEDVLGDATYRAVSRSMDVVLRGEPVDFETEVSHRDGTVRFLQTSYVPDLSNDGRVRGFFVLANDITERKQVEEELRQWADAFEHCAHGIAIGDPATNRIVACNSAYALLQKARVDDVVGAAILSLYAPAEHDRIRWGVERADQVGHSQIETNMIRRDGSMLPVQVDLVSVHGDDGELVYRVATVQDISERKKAENEIQQLNEKLEERVIERTAQLRAANKELEAFSYSISHDLRAPLRAINGYTRILVEDYAAVLDDEGRRVCQVITSEATRMGKLIDDLLSFSRLSRKEIQPARVDMKALAYSVYGELTRELERERIDFKIGKLPAAEGDPALLHQVWTNLISNAIKFSSKKERAVIEVGTRKNNGENIYYIHDNGAGFDIQYVDKLFGVFQRLHSDDEFEGTGVGLAIVQRIVQRHEGRVWAEGEVGKGATFYFALPQQGENHE